MEIFLCGILHDPGNPALVSTLEGNGEIVYSIAVSADGKTLASGNSDTTIALWDIADSRRTGPAQSLERTCAPDNQPRL